LTPTTDYNTHSLHDALPISIRPSRTGPPLHLDKRTNKTAITIGGIKKKTMKLVSPMTMPAPTSAQSQKPTQPMRRDSGRVACGCTVTSTLYVRPREASRLGRMAKSLGILTGGGDCPGLNAVIRAVVRRADAAGWDVVAVREGWRGLVESI